MSVEIVHNKVPEITTSAAAGIGSRVASIDILRGLVMVIMALDHTRDFFSNAQFNPLDLSHTITALFFTRWITHFCAPVFVLLAGIGAYLYAARGQSKVSVARFLFTRGLLLIVLEFTLVHFGWFFSFDYHFVLAQVIWMLGWSMIILAGLLALRVPLWGLTALGILMIIGHNLLDRISADRFGELRWLWLILHQPIPFNFAPGRQIYPLYSLVPWVGVIMVGYTLGSLFLLAPKERHRWLFRLGLGLTLAFVILRWSNLYGDPSHWIPFPNMTLRILSFINTTKYPPSLLFLLMTLGPALMFLAWLDRLRAVNPFSRVLVTFGRVPLIYYVLHLILIHAIAIALSYVRYGEAPWLFGTGWMFRSDLPEGYGYSLPVVYLVWLSVVVFLYPICYWFARWKREARVGWSSYF